MHPADSPFLNTNTPARQSKRFDRLNEAQTRNRHSLRFRPKAVPGEPITALRRVFRAQHEVPAPLNLVG